MLSAEAVELKGKLRDFAASSTTTREIVLPELVGFIKSGITTPDLVTSLADQTRASDNSLKRDFTRAVEGAYRTPFWVYRKGEVNPWMGEAHTLVALDKEGQILWNDASTKGRVYEEHGTNLYPYALSKAIMGLHLDLANRYLSNDQKSGLESQSNFVYIESLGFERNKTLFLGESIVKFAPEDNLFVGASGCALAEEYVREVYPGDRVPVDYLAGKADSVFARIVAGYVQDGSFLPNPPLARPEPELFAELRFAH